MCLCPVIDGGAAARILQGSGVSGSSSSSFQEGCVVGLALLSSLAFRPPVCTLDLECAECAF